jgi:hypothetical protein
MAPALRMIVLKHGDHAVRMPFRLAAFGRRLESRRMLIAPLHRDAQHAPGQRQTDRMDQRQHKGEQVGHRAGHAVDRVYAGLSTRAEASAAHESWPPIRSRAGGLRLSRVASPAQRQSLSAPDPSHLNATSTCPTLKSTSRRWAPCTRAAARSYSPGETARQWPRPGSNRRPRDYESPALPLSYRADSSSVAAAQESGETPCASPLVVHDLLRFPARAGPGRSTDSLT